MCGIAGILGPGALGDPGRATLTRMADALRHRGPDDRAVWVDGRAGVGLAHTRLAVQDLSSAGAQPMTSRDGRWTVAYNGEIYNAPELRARLERRGHAFRGHSDTEALTESFAAWGPPAVIPELNGMFAFAAFDHERRALYLARDRFGEKPLYYGRVGHDLVFASELKALERLPGWSGELDAAAVAAYLRHGYVPAPTSIYRGISKLQPGQFAVVAADVPGSEPQLREYFSPADLLRPDAPVDIGDDEAIELVHEQLRAAVRRRLVADVPLGAMLSGGIDSSTVVALVQEASASPVSTFTIGFDEPAFNEAPRAAAIARHLGTDHHELYVNDKDIVGALELAADVYDEPFGDSSQVPSLLVSSLARQRVTVALTGDGGDEIFGGYDRYLQGLVLDRVFRVCPPWIRRMPARATEGDTAEDLQAKVDRVRNALGLRTSHPDLGRRILTTSRMLALESSEQVFQALAGVPDPALHTGTDAAPSWLTSPELWPATRERLALFTWLDLVTYLPDNNLMKLDRASMSVSLEVRPPLLDPDVVQLAYRLPARTRLRGRTTKWVLRQVLRKYVPDDLVRGPKMGFSSPTTAWLHGPLREWAEPLVDEARLRRDGFLDPPAVRALWQAHEEGRSYPAHELWRCLMLNAWLDRRALR